jgi:hypothetical protein
MALTSRNRRKLQPVVANRPETSEAPGLKPGASFSVIFECINIKDNKYFSKERREEVRRCAKG